MSVLKSLKDAQSLISLAHLLGYKPNMLAYLLYKVPSVEKYTKFTVPKKGGGLREINAPAESIKLLQRRLANILYECRKEIEASQDQKTILSHAFRKKHIINGSL